MATADSSSSAPSATDPLDSGASSTGTATAGLSKEVPSSAETSATKSAEARSSTAEPSASVSSAAGASKESPSTPGPSSAGPSKSDTTGAKPKSEEKAEPKPSPTPRKKKQVYGREGIRRPRNEDGKLEESSDEEIDIHNIVPDDPLFHGFGSESIGNRPELTTLLQDEEILQRFQDEKTMDLLRRIALDTSKIEEVLAEKHPEIEFLSTKIKAVFKKSRDDREAMWQRTKAREQERVDRVKAQRMKEKKEKAAKQPTK